MWVNGAKLGSYFALSVHVVLLASFLVSYYCVSTYQRESVDSLYGGMARTRLLSFNKSNNSKLSNTAAISLFGHTASLIPRRSGEGKKECLVATVYTCVQFPRILGKLDTLVILCVMIT